MLILRYVEIVQRYGTRSQEASDFRNQHGYPRQAYVVDRNMDARHSGHGLPYTDRLADLGGSQPAAGVARTST